MVPMSSEMCGQIETFKASYWLIIILTSLPTIFGHKHFSQILKKQIKYQQWYIKIVIVLNKVYDLFQLSLADIRWFSTVS